MLRGHPIDGETIVLIVEDDPADKLMLKDICEDVGFVLENIQVAEDLEQAIGRLNQGSVDLVLLDLALDETQNPRQAVWLLERWGDETKRKKIPVIVVSRFTEVVRQAALAASCAVVIRKPGPTDGEKALFRDFVKYAIRAEISQSSGAATFWDRIRQSLDRILPGKGEHPPHVHLGIVSWPLRGATAQAVAGALLLVCVAVAVYTFARSRGWSIHTLAWLLSAILLAVIVWAVIRGKRTRPPG